MPTNYEIAEQVLAGTYKPAAPPPAQKSDESVREPKFCELSGKMFFRPVGSDITTCGQCNPCNRQRSRQVNFSK